MVLIIDWYNSFDKNGLGYSLGDFFHKLIWSPRSLSGLPYASPAPLLRKRITSQSFAKGNIKAGTFLTYYKNKNKNGLAFLISI
jgi:hypothetical protein